MSAAVRVCSTPADSVAALRGLCEWADELRLAYAWAHSSNGTAQHWKALPLPKIRLAVIGTQFAQTEPTALRVLLGCGDGVVKVIEDTGGVFHPKVIVGLKSGEAKALLGSSNFTNGGFAGNTELNVLLEGRADEAPLDEIITFLDQQWTHPLAFVSDEEWLQRYERAYDARPRPKPVPKGTAASKILVETETDLDLDWDDYYSLIEQQEGRTLSTGYEIHVFDHPEASYLQEIETCQALFTQFPSFETMSTDDRKFVGGFGGTSGYFGRMVAAGDYKNMIIERPDEIGALLDAVPASGIPTDTQVTDYLTGATAIRGVSFGTATRLLIAKRPDLFLSVNDASKGRIKRVFGRAPDTTDRYLQLLKRIWAMPWFTVLEPTTAHERRIWRVRVAILDAVLYETTKSSGGPTPFSS